jgi:hypothetical protein
MGSFPAPVNTRLPVISTGCTPTIGAAHGRRGISSNEIRGRRMQRIKLINYRLKAAALTGTVLALAALFMPPANAGCLQPDAPKKSASLWAPTAGSPRFIRATYQRVSDQEYGFSFFRPAITGLWAFQFIAMGNKAALGIPDGPFDNGNTMWFADGNELTYSGGRDPTTGSVCLGVWKQTGEFSYELNHVGLAWNPPGNPQGLPVGPAGPSFIKQFVTLDKDGNSYSGTFAITVLAPDGKTPVLPVPIKGMVVATRVTIDTTTQVP